MRIKLLVYLLTLFAISFSYLPFYDNLIKNYNCIMHKNLKSINKKICIAFEDIPKVEINFLNNKTIKLEFKNKYICLDKCLLNIYLILGGNTLTKKIINLDELEKKEINEIIYINELKYEPKTYPIFYKLVVIYGKNKKCYFKKIGTLKVRPYEIIKIKKRDNINLFYRYTEITVQNLGNKYVCKNISEKISLLDKYLINYVSWKNYEIKLNKLNFLNVCLKPKQKIIIAFAVNYIPLYLFPLSLIILIFIYLIYSSRVYIKRKIEIVDLSKKIIKFKIEITNNKEFMKYVSIIQELPENVNIINITPKNYIYLDKNTILWDINEFKVGESLILEITLQLRSIKQKFKGIRIKYINGDGERKEITEKNFEVNLQNI